VDFTKTKEAETIDDCLVVALNRSLNAHIFSSIKDYLDRCSTNKHIKKTAFAIRYKVLEGCEKSDHPLVVA
jgi:hypothetical protein